MDSTNPPEVDSSSFEIGSSLQIDWVTLILELVLLVLIVVGNTLVIVSILAAKVLRFSRNYLILSLAVADLMVGVLVLPIKMLMTQNKSMWDDTYVECYLWMSVDACTSTAIILSLTAISLDRYIAILHPLYYKVHYSHKKVIGAICAVWIISIFCTVDYWLLTYFNAEAIERIHPEIELPPCIRPAPIVSQLGVVVVTFFLPLCIMVFIHGKIWMILIQQRDKTIERRARTMRTESSSESIQQCVTKLIQERKGWITTALVLGSFVFCFLPFYLYLAIDAMCRITGLSIMTAWAYDLFAWIGYFHSSLNPIIYTMFNDDFYFVFKEILCCRCRTLNANTRNELYSRQVASNDSVMSTVAPSPDVIDVANSDDSIDTMSNVVEVSTSTVSSIDSTLNAFHLSSESIPTVTYSVEISRM